MSKPPKKPLSGHAGRITSEDVHAAMFDRKPRARSLAELKESIARDVRSQHAVKKLKRIR